MADYVSGMVWRRFLIGQAFSAIVKEGIKTGFRMYAG
jgi:hypothetical protein